MSGGMASLFITVVGFTPLPLYPLERGPVPMCRCLGGPQSHPWLYAKEKLLASVGNGIRFIGSPTRSPSPHRLSYRGYFYSQLPPESSDGISECKSFRSDVNTEIIYSCMLFDEIIAAFRTEIRTVNQVIFALWTPYAHISSCFFWKPYIGLMPIGKLLMQKNELTHFDH